MLEIIKAIIYGIVEGIEMFTEQQERCCAMNGYSEKLQK